LGFQSALGPLLGGSLPCTPEPSRCSRKLLRVGLRAVVGDRTLHPSPPTKPQRPHRVNGSLRGRNRIAPRNVCQRPATFVAADRRPDPATPGAERVPEASTGRGRVSEGTRTPGLQSHNLAL